VRRIKQHGHRRMLCRKHPAALRMLTPILRRRPLLTLAPVTSGNWGDWLEEVIGKAGPAMDGLPSGIKIPAMWGMEWK